MPVIIKRADTETRQVRCLPCFNVMPAHIRALSLITKLYPAFGGSSCNATGHSPERISYTVGDDCSDPTALDQQTVAPKARKVIEDGKLYLIRNNEKYNLLGTRIR